MRVAGRSTGPRSRCPSSTDPWPCCCRLIEARQLDVLTVPLGALADAYLDALGRLEADRLGNVSSFVTIASQLILIKSRAMLPRRTDPTDPLALADEGVDPEAELRARLLIYRAHRDAGVRLAEDALRRIGSFRREPSVARAAALAGARPVDAPPLDPRRLARALDRLAAIAAPTEPPPEIMGRTITITERAEIIRAALRDAPRVVLQDLLTGVRDRVVIAITFLAMLELMKRREIVVEQATPWGPIVARETTADERAAAGVSAAPPDEPRSTSRWSRSHDRRRRADRGAIDRGRGARRAAAEARRRRRRRRARRRHPAPIELTEAALEALLFVAEKPLSRREIAALAGTDRATVDARLGDLEVSLRDRGIRLLIDGDRVELATASDGGALVARYIGADVVRLSPASLETLAIVAYRQPVTKAAIERIRGVDSDYTIRTLLHRRFVVELGRSAAPGRPFLYGTGFEFLERFALTSLDELPPLDGDVAARLAEEGGEPVTEPLFPTDGQAD